MATLELAHPLLLFVEPLLCFPELDLEELRRTGRLALACLQILLDVVRRESVRNERDRGRITPLVTDRKGHRGLALASHLGALELQLDVLAHSSDDLFGREPLPQVGVKAEAVDQGFEARAAQNFLADRVEPSLEGTGDGSLHEGLGNLLAVYKYGGRGPIDIRQEGDEADGRRHRTGECKNRKPLPPAPDGQHPVQTGP